MIELTEQQRQEIQQGGWPPEFRDPKTGVHFVLLRKEMFERVRAILEEEDEIAAVEEMYPLVGEVLDAGDSDARESALNSPNVRPEIRNWLAATRSLRSGAY